MDKKFVAEMDFLYCGDYTSWWSDEENVISSYVGITILAKDDIVVYAAAWSCTSQYVFFGEHKLLKQYFAP